MTVRDGVSEIRSMFKLVNMDDLISDRAIASAIKTTSLKFIKQQTDKRKLLSSPNIFTELTCLKMQQVPLAECCTYISECTISRSVAQIPKIAENIYGLLVQGVWSIDKKNEFSQMDANRYANSLRLKLKNPKQYYWVLNNYLYISSPDIELATISACFEDDIDFTKYTCDDSVPDCNENPLDLEFKCPGFLQRDIFSEVYTTMLKTYKNSQDDKTSDQNDTSK